MKLSQVRVRKAADRDKSPILEICRKIWDGGDYVPRVWDDWIRDKKGHLVVATVGTTPVAVAHAYLQSPDVAWLEGVRVHEQYRGIGIAGRLNHDLASWAAAEGARVARLCTGSSNLASRKHLAKVGWEVMQTFQRLDSTRDLSTKPSSIMRPRKPLKGLWGWLVSRPEFADNRAMYSDGWTWHPLTSRSFNRQIANRRVLLTARNRQLSSCSIFLDEDQTLTLGFCAGKPKDVVMAGRMLRFLLTRKKHRKVRALVPSKSPLVQALERGGFEKAAKILVYEKFLG